MEWFDPSLRDGYYFQLNIQVGMTRLVLRIVINIIRGRTLDEIAPVQYGFMPDKGTGNAIFALRRLVERLVEKQRDVYTCFIDFSKAFDTVKHESLVENIFSLLVLIRVFPNNVSHNFPFFLNVKFVYFELITVIVNLYISQI